MPGADILSSDSPIEQGQTTRAVTLLLVDGVSMMSLASAIEPLRSLNRLIDREAWRWRLASLDGGTVVASNGIPLPTAPVETAVEGADYVFVCGGLPIQSADERRYDSVLRKVARLGIAVGSLSTGTYLLARAGLLDGYRCTIHWENRPALMEEFPNLICTEKIYEIDRDRLTCSGGTAAMDLMLQLIVKRHGAELARRVANQFHHERIRDERDSQSGGRLERLASLPLQLRNALRLMKDHTEDPIAIADIAHRCGMSARQIERLFKRHFEMSPARYYIAMRIDRARELLLYSNRSILDVAVSTGFASTSHFSQWFRRLVGMRPSELQIHRKRRLEIEDDKR